MRRFASSTPYAVNAEPMAVSSSKRQRDEAKRWQFRSSFSDTISFESNEIPVQATN